MKHLAFNIGRSSYWCVAALLSLLVFTSCEKEDESFKDLLVMHAWKQAPFAKSWVSPGEKQFYRINFRQDNTCEIILDYMGPSYLPSDPFTPIIDIDTVETTYTFDPSTRILSFPEPISTVYWNGETTPSFVFLNSWKIKSIGNGKMETEAVENYTPPSERYFLVCMNSYKFERTE